MSKVHSHNKGVPAPAQDRKPKNGASAIFCEADMRLFTNRRNSPRDEVEQADADDLDMGALAKGLVVGADGSDPHKMFGCLKESIHVIYSRRKINSKVQELGKQLSAAYSSRRLPLVVLGVLKGCSPFLSDLLRTMNEDLPMEVEFIGASFYGNETVAKQNGSVHLPDHLRLKGKDVLVVDDILDTGNTLNSIITRLYELEPQSIKGCVLMEKLAQRVHYIPEIQYRGFAIEDGWVVGYGMDYKQYFRNLPYIGVITLEDANRFDLS